VELRTRASEDYVTVAKEAIRQTYTVLYARLGRDEQLLPAITVLLEESRRGAELMEKVSAKLDRIDARVETLSPVVSQQPGGRVVVGEIPALLLFPWAG
jgi:hypothetical protein